MQRLERIQHKFLSFLAGTRRDRFNMVDYDSLCISYKMEKLVKRRGGLDLSFMYCILTNRVASTLLLSSFSMRTPIRFARNFDLLYVPSYRVNASISAIFSRLPRSFNTFLSRHPSFDLFHDLKSIMLRLFYADA